MDVLTPTPKGGQTENRAAVASRGDAEFVKTII